MKKLLVIVAIALYSIIETNADPILPASPFSRSLLILTTAADWSSTLFNTGITNYGIARFQTLNVIGYNVGTQASGTATFTGQPAGAETITIGDGATTLVFSFTSGGDVTVTIGASKEATAANLLTAITNNLQIIGGVSGAIISLTNSAIGTSGNVTITTTAGNITPTGMAGGVTDFFYNGFSFSSNIFNVGGGIITNAAFGSATNNCAGYLLDSTTDLAKNTFYTNGTKRAWVAQSVSMTSALTGSSQMVLLVSTNAGVNFRTNGLATAGATVAETAGAQLVAELGPNDIFIITNVLGTGASGSFVAGTSIIKYR